MGNLTKLMNIFFKFKVNKDNLLELEKKIMNPLAKILDSGTKPILPLLSSELSLLSPMAKQNPWGIKNTVVLLTGENSWPLMYLLIYFFPLGNVSW